MARPDQTFKRRLEQAGFGPAIIRECQRLADSDTRWTLVAGAGGLGLAVTLALSYLFQRWSEVLEPYLPWMLLAYLALNAFGLARGYLGPVFKTPKSASQTAQLEARAISHIYHMARDAERDPSGQHEAMLQNFADRLVGTPDDRQPSALVDILELDRKPMGPMEWYQVGLVLTILAALALAIWQFAPAP